MINLFLPLLTAISEAGSPNCPSVGCGSLSRAAVLGVSSLTVGRTIEEPPTEESMEGWRLLDLLDGEDESVLKRVPPWLFSAK